MNERQGSWIGALLIAAMVAGVFGEFLFGDGSRLPSHELGDTVNYFVAARDFAIEHIRNGELPLWNPHTFSGTPFVGVFQSAVFYPLAALHLVLSPARAFSVEFALDVFLLGLFVFLWLRRWRLSWLACCFAAAIVMFGGTASSRVLAGQLSVLGTFTWVPLVLLAVDHLAERPRREWVLVGIVGTSLALLAGHPPTFFMAGAAIGLYSVPLVLGSSERGRLVAVLACIPVGAFLVTAVQLWTGLQVATEGARTQGLSYAAATSFSMPPENLLTLVAPGFFGDASRIATCFGRWWCWDVSAFIGCAALALAIHGAFAVRGHLRNRFLTLAAILTIVALGRYTPVYAVLYDVLPGFQNFRAPSKFMFFACLFVAGLAALGADHLLKDGDRDRRGGYATLGIASFVLALAAWQWLGVERLIAIEPPTHWVASLESRRTFAGARLARWDALAAAPLLRAGFVLAAASVLLWLAPARRWPGLLLIGIGAVELLAFAEQNHGSIPLLDPLKKRPQLAKIYAGAGETRVLERRLATNAAVAARGYNVWGYDPMFLQRYAEFIAFTQGRDVAKLLDNNRGLQPDRFHPLLSMLRVGFSAAGPIDGARPLPRVLLVRDYRVEASPEAVLAALDEPSFDPRRTVILEQLPTPPPEPATGPDGDIQVTDVSTDCIRIEAEVNAPAILLVTDAYAAGWHARALPGSAQESYEVQRANAVLRAVPLEAGVHRFELVYAPLAFRAGAWVSGASSLALLALAGLRLRRRGRRP